MRLRVPFPTVKTSSKSVQ